MCTFNDVRQTTGRVSVRRNLGIYSVCECLYFVLVQRSDVTANLLCPTYDLDIAAQRVVDSIEQNEVGTEVVCK
jgi:hypothetical protein